MFVGRPVARRETNGPPSENRVRRQFICYLFAAPTNGSGRTETIADEEGHAVQQLGSCAQGAGG